MCHRPDPPPPPQQGGQPAPTDKTRTAGGTRGIVAGRHQRAAVAAKREGEAGQEKKAIYRLAVKKKKRHDRSSNRENAIGFQKKIG